jgi:hypothetical protein
MSARIGGSLRAGPQRDCVGPNLFSPLPPMPIFTPKDSPHGSPEISYLFVVEWIYREFLAKKIRHISGRITRHELHRIEIRVLAVHQMHPLLPSEAKLNGLRPM